MPLNMRFRFSPAKDGLVKVLGPLETEIMQIVWQDERSTVKKVHRKLSSQRVSDKQRDSGKQGDANKQADSGKQGDANKQSESDKQREIAYTTVMTTMSRLAEKGVLHRHREGLAYVYSPAITEDDFVTMVVQNVLDGLLQDYSETAVDYMLDYFAQRNPSELKRIQRAVQARVAA